MRARSIVLIVLMSVVIVGASASVWLPSVSRRLGRPAKQETLANTPTWKVAKQPDALGREPSTLQTPKRFTRIDLSQEEWARAYGKLADENQRLLMENQALKQQIAGLQQQNAVLGFWIKAQVAYKGPVYKGPLRDQTERLIKQGQNLSDQISTLQEQIRQADSDREDDQIMKRMTDEDRELCEMMNSLNGALDIDAGCR